MANTSKNKTKPKWERPIITAVRLSPDEAVLQICIGNGAWYASNAVSYCYDDGSYNYCSYSPKGPIANSADAGVYTDSSYQS